MPATVLGNQHVTIGVGSTAQRPGTPVQGMIRLNTSINQVEIYDGSQWTPLVAPSYNTLTINDSGDLIQEQIISGASNDSVDGENALSAFFSNNVSISIDSNGNLVATY